MLAPSRRLNMKALLIYVLVLVGFCHAENASFAHLSKLLNPGQIIRIDCYIGAQLTDIKDPSRLGKYLTEESKFFSVEDENLLREVSSIFNQRSFVKKRILISPKLRTYNMFVFVFSNQSELVLINSSGFGLDQFVVGEISGEPHDREVREIQIYVRGDRKEEMISLSLPGFQESAFLSQAVRTK